VLPCPACTYLKAVRGAATVPVIQPALPSGIIPVAPHRLPSVAPRLQVRLASRAPPAL
jgi:hypothetical protein